MNQNKIITISRQYGSGGRIVGKKLAEIELPVTSKICAVARDGEVFFPEAETVLCADDVIILYVSSKGIKKAERLFA